MNKILESQHVPLETVLAATPYPLRQAVRPPRNAGVILFPKTCHAPITINAIRLPQDQDQGLDLFHDPLREHGLFPALAPVPRIAFAKTIPLVQIEVLLKTMVLGIQELGTVNLNPIEATKSFFHQLLQKDAFDMVPDLLIHVTIRKISLLINFGSRIISFSIGA